MFLFISAAAANSMMLPAIEAKALKPNFKAEFNEGGAAAVQVRLVVSPDGVPIHCERSFLNGPPSNAEAFCSQLRTSTRFRPAQDGLGQPTFGVVYLWSHWADRRWKGSQVPRWNPVDLALTTNKRPKGFAEGSQFLLILRTNAKGAVEKCGVAGERIEPELANLLCREAAAEPVTPASDESGHSVASVQQFVVRLISQPALDKVVKRIQKR